MSKEERDAYVRREWDHARTVWEAADAVGCHANTLAVSATIGTKPGASDPLLFVDRAGTS